MIVSLFYLIEGEGNPIYVGFTNRDLHQRFVEHKREKDFSSFSKVEIREIGRLEYQFTWDVGETYNNAKVVSDKEAELINQYGTQDSPYQKARGGGGVWNEIKRFVTFNSKNPAFRYMSEEEVSQYLKLVEKNSHKIKGYIDDTDSPDRARIRQYLSNSMYKGKKKVDAYIGGTVNPVKAKLSFYLYGSRSPMDKKAAVYINGTKTKSGAHILHYLSATLSPPKSKTWSYVGSSDNTNKRKVKTYIGHSVPIIGRRIEGYISNTKEVVKNGK